MSAAFVRARKRLAPDQSKALLVNQRRWLKTRSDECFGGSAVSHCLLAENKARISVLEPRPVAGHALRLVLVETPLTKTAYALGLLLYKFADPRNAAEQTFDADIDKRIAEAPRKREADDQAGNDYEAYETASVAHASDKLLSVKVDTLLWGGGPHPDDGSETINIDMATGKNLRLDDLVDEAGRAAIVRDCRKQYSEDEQERQSANDADIAAIADKQMKDAVGDLANWTFASKEATIELGRLDGYALGHFQCTLAYETFRRLAKPSFPLP